MLFVALVCSSDWLASSSQDSTCAVTSFSAKSADSKPSSVMLVTVALDRLPSLISPELTLAFIILALPTLPMHYVAR